MSAPSANHEAHDYAERIRERLPRRLQELREAAGMSKYALAKKAGVSRDMVGCIENGESIPTLHVTARLAHGIDMTLTRFVEVMEDERKSSVGDVGLTQFAGAVLECMAKPLPPAMPPLSSLPVTLSVAPMPLGASGGRFSVKTGSKRPGTPPLNSTLPS